MINAIRFYIVIADNLRNFFLNDRKNNIYILQSIWLYLEFYMITFRIVKACWITRKDQSLFISIRYLYHFRSHIKHLMCNVTDCEVCPYFSLDNMNTLKTNQSNMIRIVSIGDLPESHQNDMENLIKQSMHKK